MSAELFEALIKSDMDVVSVFREPGVYSSSSSLSCGSFSVSTSTGSSFEYLSPSAYNLLGLRILHRGEGENGKDNAHDSIFTPLSVLDFPPAPYRGAHFARLAQDGGDKHRPVFFRNTFWKEKTIGKGLNVPSFVSVSVDEHIS